MYLHIGVIHEPSGVLIVTFTSVLAVKVYVACASVRSPSSSVIVFKIFNAGKVDEFLALSISAVKFASLALRSEVAVAREALTSNPKLSNCSLSASLRSPLINRLVVCVKSASLALEVASLAFTSTVPSSSRSIPSSVPSLISSLIFVIISKTLSGANPKSCIKFEKEMALFFAKAIVALLAPAFTRFPFFKSLSLLCKLPTGDELLISKSCTSVSALVVAVAKSSPASNLSFTNSAKIVVSGVIAMYSLFVIIALNSALVSKVFKPSVPDILTVCFVCSSS